MQTLRAAAKKLLSDGAVTDDYEGDVKASIGLLQNVLATEIERCCRYHAFGGISLEGIK